jgi:CheY-like chemotaxis protein
VTTVSDSLLVLVVDDEASVRDFAERSLRGAGYEVQVASDGPEALAVMDAQRRSVNLFLVDLVMPLMRGDELARRIRQRDPDAKVLYFTGHSDRLFEGRQTLSHHEAFIEKPVTIAGLLEAVSLLLFGHTGGPTT